MDEKDLAAELQASKGDLTEWDERSPKDTSSVKAPKRRLAAMVSIRLSPEELEAVQARAAELGQSVSGYLRHLALRDARLPCGSVPAPTPGIWTSSPGTYSSRIEHPRVTDGRYLNTYAS